MTKEQQKNTVISVLEAELPNYEVLGVPTFIAFYKQVL